MDFVDLLVCYLKLQPAHLLTSSLYHSGFHHSKKVFETYPSSTHFQEHFATLSFAIAGIPITHDVYLIDADCFVGNCHCWSNHYIPHPCFAAVTMTNLIHHSTNYSGTAAYRPYFHLHPSYYCYWFIAACLHSYRLLESFLVYG